MRVDEAQVCCSTVENKHHFISFYNKASRMFFFPFHYYIILHTINEVLLMIQHCI